jgi:hypothetical protein
MFRTAVMEFQDAVRAGNLKEARAGLRTIEARFMGDDSAFEVNRQARKGRLIDLPDEELKVDLFDGILQQIDRDLGRSLQTLWASSVFRVFIKYRAILNQINSLGPVSPTLGTMRPGAGGATQQVQTEVRFAFHSQQPLRLQRHFEVGSPYPYKLTQRDSDAIVGFARQTNDQFCFFDLQDREVLQVSAVALLGNAAIERQQAPPEDDDDVAGSGCCSPVRSRSSECWLLRSFRTQEHFFFVLSKLFARHS